MIQNWNYQKGRISLLSNLFVDQGDPNRWNFCWLAGFNEQFCFL